MTMQRHDLPNDERLQALLADRATDGLSNAEANELRDQLGAADTDALDTTASALQLHWHAMSNDTNELPASLRSRVTADAQRHFAGNAAQVVEGESAFVLPMSAAVEDTDEAVEIGRGLGLLGWFAAAAAIVVAVIGWMPRTQDEPRIAREPTVTELRQQLLIDRSDVVQLAWAGLAQPGFEDVQGDVVWSDAAQAGYMRLVGMPANDPQQSQYQLWIVDPEVDKHPVDGGVFDIDKDTGELIIPIDAKLDVQNPAAFVITAERPGGVVVSDGPHLVIAAAKS
jgi:hypothetical protein